MQEQLYQRLIRQSTITLKEGYKAYLKLYQRLIRQSTITQNKKKLYI